MSAETFNPRNLPIKTAAPVLPHPRRAGMETIEIGGPDIVASRIALGTWAIGGWMWGGSDARSAFRTIQAAIDNSVNLIDTAPVYGFGHAEEVVESLKRLKTDYIDIYHLHWPDPNIPIEETAGAFAKLLQAGKIRAIGVSNLDRA